MRWRFAVAAVLAVALSGCGQDDPMQESRADESAVTTTAPTTTAPTRTSQTTTAPTTTAPTTTPPATTVPTTTTPPPPPPAATGVTVTTGNSQYGEMLFDGTGQAIYLFDLETSPEARCYGNCAVAWPPVLTDGPPQASGAAKSGLLGSTQRDDGTTQVTYAGHPLYYYVDDGKNEVLCHDVVEFGGLWLVVTPAGEGGPH
ncbi:MAG: hypothetical protein H0T85_11520 [Geodermatophilaceae bacterium]|nr:hypothetical protein [Geodermatophilaceae bacterium]